eukprot:gene7784-10574_t
MTDHLNYKNEIDNNHNNNDEIINTNDKNDEDNQNIHTPIYSVKPPKLSYHTHNISESTTHNTNINNDDVNDNFESEIVESTSNNDNNNISNSIIAIISQKDTSQTVEVTPFSSYKSAKSISNYLKKIVANDTSPNTEISIITSQQNDTTKKRLESIQINGNNCDNHYKSNELEEVWKMRSEKLSNRIETIELTNNDEQRMNNNEEVQINLIDLPKIHLSDTTDEVTKYYPHDALKYPGPYPPDVNVRNRESYLNDNDFINILGVDRVAWDNMPKWKQQSKKKNAKLF